MILAMCQQNHGQSYTYSKTHTKTNTKTKKGENCIHIDNQAEMPSTLDPVYVHIPSIKLNLIFAQLYAV